jgi:ABC-type multidrug transport system ATPase subunit
VEGRVQVNGADRDLKNFRKRSAYITQKDHLLSNLTVDEYMLAAAHLKLGNDVSNKKKKSIVSYLQIFRIEFIVNRICCVYLPQIENVLATLGLTEAGRTRISCLSGGECKRLSIALELVNNPTILFLDEPTR